VSRPLLVFGAFVALSLTLALPPRPARASAPLAAPDLAVSGPANSRVEFQRALWFHVRWRS
jgi:hypothetical protein